MEKNDLSGLSVSELTHDDWRELADQVETMFHRLAPKGTSITFTIMDESNVRCVGGCFNMPSAIRAIADTLKIVTAVFNHNINVMLDNKDTEGLHKLTTSPMILIPLVTEKGTRPVIRAEAEEIANSLPGDGVFLTPITAIKMEDITEAMNQEPIIKPKNRDIH